MRKISFVYFDVGGVVVNDFSETNKWEQMKRDIKIPSKYDTDFDIFYDRFEGEVNLGRDVDTIIPIIKKKYRVSLDGNYSMLEDFIDRFEVNEFIWPIIRKIKKHCGVGLLTNMYPRMLRGMINKNLLLEPDWDAVVDSSIEKIKKPDRKIFELAEKRAVATGKKILFVDNKQMNIEAAKDFGWQTFFYDSSDYEGSSKKLESFLKVKGTIS